MRIAVDARFYNEAGPGRYVKNIIGELEKLDSKNSYFILLRKDAYTSYFPKAFNFTKILADYPWYSFSEQILFLFTVIFLKTDIFYVPHFNVPVFYPGKLVTAIPDLIMHDYSTEEGTTLPRKYYKFKKLLYFFVVFMAVLKSKKIIVPSMATLSDMKQHYKFVTDSKLVLAYEGIDKKIVESSKETAKVSDTLLLEDLEIRKPYLLYVGSMYLHKNVDRLLQAFRILKDEKRFEGCLVIIGKKDQFSAKIKELAQKLFGDNSVLLPGESQYIDDDKLSIIRRNALCYVFPSLKEGFSLTPLEAMVFNVPCVISDIACHKEIYGKACLYFNPLDPKDMAEKIDLMITDEQVRERLRDEVSTLLAKYDWANTAADTLKVFEGVFKDG